MIVRTKIIINYIPIPIGDHISVPLGDIPDLLSQNISLPLGDQILFIFFVLASLSYSIEAISLLEIIYTDSQKRNFFQQHLSNFLNKNRSSL